MQTLLLLAAVALLVAATLVLRRRRTQASPGPASMAALYASDPRALPTTHAPDYAFLDDYLARWDRFARGENDLMPELQAEVRRFNGELASAVRSDPQRAVGRAILYPLLQVGGFVPLESALGQALAEALGAAAPATTTLGGRAYYFAGDLYFWWEDHRSRFAPFAPYEVWRERPFARETAIPMYEGVRSRRRR